MFLQAQPRLWGKPFQPEGNKNKSFYVRSGEKALKDKYYQDAVAYAAQAMTLDLSKRQLKKCLEVLNGSYNHFLTGHEKSVLEKKENSQDKINDDEMNRRHDIFRLYSELHSVNEVLNQVPGDKFRTKKASFDFVYKDFSSEMEAAEKHRDAGRPAAAGLHYKIAEGLFDPEGKDRGANKEAAKEYRIAMAYMNNYKDVSEKHEKAKFLGTARMSIHHFLARNPADLPAFSSLSPEHTIFSTLHKHASKATFFEVFPDLTVGMVIYQTGNAQDYNKVVNQANMEFDEKEEMDYRLVCIYDGYEVTKKVADPKTKKEENEVVVREVKTKNSEGKEETTKIKEKVYATITEYSKELYLTLTATYSVIEIATGETVQTGQASSTERWSHAWAKYSGNEKALSSYQKGLAKTTDKPWPDVKPLLKEAAKQLGENIGGKLTGFINREGS